MLGDITVSGITVWLFFQYGQQTQLLHVFQEQLLTGKVSKGDNSSGMEPIVDLRNLGSFEELFYLVVLEKNKDCGSTLHMWKMTIASQAGTVGEGISARTYVVFLGPVGFF